MIHIHTRWIRVNTVKQINLYLVVFVSFAWTGMKSLRLNACREDGVLESQTVELTWDMISQWESDEESMAFCFQYSRNDKPPRWVKVQTPYVSFILSKSNCIADLF